jgi:hypothetical protein
VVKGAGAARLDDLTIRIQNVLADLDSTVDAPISVSELIDELRWWHRFCLTARIEPAVSNKGAFLTEIVKKCPCDATKIILDEFPETEPKILFTDLQAGMVPPVFCPEDLLRDLVSHIKLNAAEYYRIPGADQRFDITIRASGKQDEFVEISVLNTGSTATVPRGGSGGKGLRTISEELKAFGGRLHKIIDFTPPWTYGIRIYLERWRIL